MRGSIDGVDIRVYEELRSVLGASLVEIVDSFLTETPKGLAALSAAVENGDPEILRATAHQLKSSCASLGAVHLSAIMRELEALGAEARLERAGQQVEAAHESFGRAREFFRLTHSG